MATGSARSTCWAVLAVAVGLLMLSLSIVPSDVGERIAHRTTAAYRVLPQPQRERSGDG
jgi:hypothetical protein